MAYRYHVWLVTLALAGVVGTACRTQRPAGTGTGEPRTARNTAASKTEIESPKDADKRVEVHVHYAMGVLHELNEETNEAIEEFTKSIEGDPGNEALVIELSRKLVQLKRYTKAEELLTRATARPQASANLFARLGLVYYFLGKKEQAITANNTALKKNPRLLSAYQNLFQLYLQSNQHDDALKVLERASLQSDPQAGY